MRAIVFNHYGSPDVLQQVDTDKPTPKENEILVKVYAAAANPLDWHRMRGEPIIARLSEGFFKPKNPRLGADFAGIVEAVGSRITQFKPGDAVFGETWSGTFAEYVCVTENQIALKPNHLSFEAAAGVPVAAFTALQGLRDKGQIQKGQSVLVNGASGGVGTFAVQIAKAYGAEVTGVCSTRNLELVRSIGADYLIDYTQEDFTRTGKQYDLVYDAVGNRSVLDLRRALKPNGICTIAGFSTMGWLFKTIFLSMWLSRNSSQKIGLMGTAQPNQPDLRYIKDLLEAQKITTVIDRCYPFSETAEAIRYLEQGRARGKVIVKIAPDN